MALLICKKEEPKRGSFLQKRSVTKIWLQSKVMATKHFYKRGAKKRSIFKSTKKERHKVMAKKERDKTEIIVLKYKRSTMKSFYFLAKKVGRPLHSSAS